MYDEGLKDRAVEGQTSREGGTQSYRSVSGWTAELPDRNGEDARLTYGERAFLLKT